MGLSSENCDPSGGDWRQFSGLGVATVWLPAQFSILSPLLLGDTILWLTSAELAEGIN